MEILNNVVNVPDIVSNENLFREERKLKTWHMEDSSGDERHGGLVGMAKIDDRFYRKFFKDGSVYVYDLETETETLDTTGTKISW